MLVISAKHTFLLAKAEFCCFLYSRQLIYNIVLFHAAVDLCLFKIKSLVMVFIESRENVFLIKRHSMAEFWVLHNPGLTGSRTNKNKCSRTM